MVAWKLQYGLSVLSFILAVVLISQLLRQRRAPGSTVAWLLLMVLLPHVGVPFFLIMGSRKLKRSRQLKRGLYQPIPFAEISKRILPMERMLRASGVPPKVDGNQLEVLATSQGAYEALVELLLNAQHQIHITTFILTLDPVGKSIVDILEKKALAGVQVRLLLDGLGSFWTFRWRLKPLLRAGGRLAFYQPVIHVPFFGHINMRNHRKLVIVDGKDAMLGGMNLAREYLGTALPENKRWADLSVKVTGNAVRDLEAVFVADWHFASGEMLSPAPITRGGKNSVNSSDETLQIVASGPDIHGDPLYDSIISAIFDAKKRIWIATPYFIPDETLSKSLELAAKRGVDVRLLIPRKSNHRLADLCRGAYLGQLERAGGKIYYSTDAMMHAKAVIVDDLYSVIGSANLDMRSLLLNYEVGLFLYSQSGIQAIGQWFEGLLTRSIRIPLTPNFASDLVEGLARLIGPFL